MPKGKQQPAEPQVVTSQIVKTFYTISRRPGECILCRHFLSTDGKMTTEFTPWLSGASLEEVRGALHKRVNGLTNMGRQPDDAPTIVETWY
jgi:hypothetical protein